MRLSLLLFIVCAGFYGNAQTSRELIDEAINQMETKNYEKAMELLKKAETLAPTDMAPVYEMGMIFYIQGKTKEAIPYFQKTITRSYVNKSAESYAMVGNCYDMEDDSVSAVRVYQDGRKKYPESGRLWLEEGHLYTHRKYYSKAMCMYETGIKVEPAMASLHRGAAGVWALTDERFHVLMFAETFMNLEQKGSRNEQMSELMYEVMNAAMVFEGASVNVTLTKNMIATLDKDEVVLPMAATYEAGFMLATTPMLIARPETEAKVDLTIKEIYELYCGSNKEWFSNNRNKRYPSKILDRQKQLMDQKLLEPYIYWLYRKGKPDEFKVWLSSHNAQYNQLVEWLAKNELKLSKETVYTSGFACK